MFLTHSDHFQSLDTWRQIDRWMEELQQAVAPQAQLALSAPIHAPLNIWANDHVATVTAEVPGINPSDVEISVHGDALTIALKSTVAESEPQTTRQTWSRTVHLPFTIDANRTEALCQHGLLTITLQRPESEQPKTITVKAA